MKTQEKNLILRIIGGAKENELIPIEIEQCLLGNDPQCAIVRTPDGVQIQARTGTLLINDQPTKVKWLQEGDIVQLGTSKFAIANLGTLEPAAPIDLTPPEFQADAPVEPPQQQSTPEDPQVAELASTAPTSDEQSTENAADVPL